MPNGIDFRRFYILDFRSGANCLAPIFEWHDVKGTIILENSNVLS